MSAYVIACGFNCLFAGVFARLVEGTLSNKHFCSACCPNYASTSQSNSTNTISIPARDSKMSTNDNTSTLKSYVDSATGAIHSGIAAITGSAGDQANADQAKAKAEAESDLSHSAAKAGPFTISSTGAPAKDNTDRTQGQYDQTMGSVKEAVGNLIGNENLKAQGREQNLQGQGQEAKGQLSDLGQGISDRVGGTVGSAIAGLTGNTTAQDAYQQQHVSMRLSICAC